MAAPIGASRENKSPKMKEHPTKRKAVRHVAGDDMDGTSPKKKCGTSEFTEIEFKVGLKDSSTRFTVLDRFVEEAEKFPDSTKYDIIEGYCRSSAECREVLMLLECDSSQKRKPKELCSIFAVLESILVNVASRLPKYKHVGLAVVQRMLTGHLGSVFYMLQAQNKTPNIKVAVKLLSAMVMQGGNAPRDILRQVDFQHRVFPALLERRDMREPMDVRAFMIHFLLSFLIVGDKEVTTQILEAKGVLNNIFPGLIADKLNVLEMLLPTLLDKVVKNPDVSKTVKVRLCNQTTLMHLAKLYRWSGPKKWNHGKKDTEEPVITEEEHQETVKREDQKLVVEMVHKLMLILCCDFKLGINFFDKSYGTSGKSLNHVLTVFLKSLHQPFLSPHLCELVVRVLRACPDQLVWYLPDLRTSLTPRVSSKWVSAMQLLYKIYTSQPTVAPSMKQHGRVTVHKLVTMATANLAPPKEAWSQILAAIRHKVPVVQHEGLCFLLLVLKRVKATLEFSKEITMFSASDMDSFASSLKDSMVKICPDLATLLNCWSRVVKSIGTKTPDSKMDESKTTEDDDDVDMDDVVTKGFPEVSSADHLLTVLQTLCEYQTLFPGNFAENFVNFSSLLEGVRTLATDDDTSTHEVALVQLHLLQLLAESNLKQITWLKESISGRSTLYLLLEMLVSTHSNPKMVSIATNLLQKLLVSTGVFEHTEAEVAVWLSHLAECGGTNRPVLRFAEQVFGAVIRDPFSYTETVSETVAEAMVTAAGTGGETGSATTGPDHLVDFILSLDEVELDDSEEAVQTLPQEGMVGGDQSSRFPFSALIPAAIKLWTEQADGMDDEQLSGVRTYLCRVVHAVLHHQTDPLPLCILLQQQQATWLDPSCIRWLSSVTSPSKKNKKSKNAVKPDWTEATTVGDFLTATFSGGSDVILNVKVQGQLRSLVQEMSLEESEDVVKKILLYMRTHALCVLEDDSHSEVVKFYLDLIANIQGAIILHEPAANNENKHAADGNENKPAADGNENKHATDVIETSTDDISGETALPAEPSKQFSSLHVLTMSSTEALERLVTLVADHPDIEHWFLWERSIGTKGRAAKLGARLRRIVTSKCATIFGRLPQDLALSTQCVLEKYRTKAFGQFAAYMEGLLSDAVASDEGVDAMDALAALMGVLPWCDVIKSAFYLGGVATTTPYGKEMLLSVLSHIISRMRKDPILIRNVTESLSLHTVSQLCSLASKGSMPDLDVALFDLVSLCPLFVMGTHEAHFRQCVASPPEGAAHKMAALVVAHSKAGRRWFRYYWFERSKEEKNNIKWDLLDVALPYCRCLASDGDDGGKEMRQMHKVYFADLFEWIQSDAAGQVTYSEERHTFLTILTNTIDNAEACWSEYLSFVVGAPVVSVGQVQYAFTLSAVVMRTDTALPAWAVCAGACLTAVTNLLTGRGKSQHKAALTELLTSLNDMLQTRRCDADSLVDVVRPLWSGLVKAGLRDMYTDPQTLDLFTRLVPLVYRSLPGDVTMPAHVMYQMLTSHSRFLGVMLQETPTQVKGALVDLLLTVAQQDPPACCQSSSHVTALLGAYGASLSTTDQRLLLLMALYERTGRPMDQHKPFLWGPKGVEHHSVKKSLGNALRTRAESQQVMELLSPDRLASSSLRFPLQRKLASDHVTQPGDMTSQEVDYDPCFLLPLFSHMLQPGHLVDCFEFVQSGCLGYVLTALSCHDRALRGAAYHALAEFYQQAEGSRFPAKDQVLYLLQVVRNSVPTANMKLAPIVTAFLNRAVKLMVTPDAPLYSAVNEFLLLKPVMDVLNVPEFYKLFNSSAMEYKSDRAWILSLLVDGLRETADYRIFEKRYTFKLLLSFHDSSLSDMHTQLQVLQVLHQAVRQRTVAADLVKHHGVLAWINAAIATSATDTEKQHLLMGIMDTLWRTMLATGQAVQTRTGDEGMGGEATGGKATGGEGRMESEPKMYSKPLAERRRRLPLAFTNEMLHLVLHLLQLMRIEDDIQVVGKLVACLGSILGHLKKTIISMNCDLPPLRVKVKVTDVLQMLHLWSCVVREEDRKWELHELLSELGHFQMTDSESVRVPMRTHQRKSISPKQSEETGVVLAGCDLQEKCIRNILQVIMHWLPMEEEFVGDIRNEEASKAEAASILFVASWSLSQCHALFTNDLQVLCDILEWFRTWVLSASSTGLRSSLAADTATAKAITSQLLTVYALCTKALPRAAEMDAKQPKAASGGDVEVLKQARVYATEILAMVVDHIVNHAPGKCPIQRNLNRKSFKNAWNGLNAVRGDHNALSLFIQELWLDAHKPSHFTTVVLDTVQNKV